MRYRFEWDYDIKSQNDFDNFKNDMLEKENKYLSLPYNYEQAARLFYEHDNGECILIELQVPTYEYMTLCEYTKEECGTWLDAYEIPTIDNDDAYDASYEIESNYDVDLTFLNAEIEMLNFAKKIFN